jgi:hypothetical protein
MQIKDLFILENNYLYCVKAYSDTIYFLEFSHLFSLFIAIIRLLLSHILIS